MYPLILHGRRFLELQKWRSLRVSSQNAISFSNSFSSACARDRRKKQTFTFCYLVDSLSLTAKTAESISTKVSFDVKRSPDSVLSLLRSYGFTYSQISAIVTNYPRLLMLDAERSLGPKLKFLQTVKGSSSSELTETLSKVPKILRMKGDQTISRYYDFVKEITKSGKSSNFEKFEKFEKSCRSLPQGMQNNKIRNVSILRELGVPERLLLPLLISTRKLVCGKEKFRESLKKVVEMGFEPTSSQFVEALGAVQGLSEKAIQEKVNVYKKLGFAERDVWEMFKKCPVSLRVSEEKLTRVFESLKICGLLEDEIPSVLKKFPRCVGYSEQKIANSIETFLDLGFSRDEFAAMVQRFPPCLGISAETVKKKTKFRLRKMKWSLEAVVSYPEVLGYSMEKRIVPRCNVMKALMSKGLLGNREIKLPDKESVLVCTDDDFLERFVRNHDDKELVAELMAIYTRDSASS